VQGLKTSRFPTLVFALVVCGISSALAQSTTEPIKIGDINSYTTFAAFTQPYRSGADLAVEQINAAGGVNGRKLQVIYRDDAGKPDEAVKQAEELVSNEKVALLAGTFLSSTGLALSDFAARRQKVAVIGIPISDAIIWEKGNRYTFHIPPTTDMHTRLLAKAAAQLPAKRWATIAPNYEFGTSFVAGFKTHLSKLRPDIQWVSEQWPALGKLNAGPIVDAINASRPDAIFNATFGADLVRLVREGTVRNFFKDRSVVSAITGKPEYLDPMSEAPPVGWIVSGYPWYAIKLPEHQAFVAAYQAKYNDYPREASVYGYITYKFLAAGLAKAGSTDTDKLIAAFEGLKFETPLGPAEMRAADHQTDLPVYIGTVAIKDGKPIMADVQEEAGAKLLPSQAEARKLRPAQ